MMVKGGQCSVLGRFRVLGLDLVLPLERLVDLGKVICPLGDCLRVALGQVALLKMSLLSEYAHLAYCQHLIL